MEYLEMNKEFSKDTLVFIEWIQLEWERQLQVNLSLLDNMESFHSPTKNIGVTDGA